jgi:hypothetical protein
MSEISRRHLLAAGAACSGAAAAASPVPRAIVELHDRGVENYLKAQDTDPASRWRGSFADTYELHYAGSASGCMEAFAAAFLHPESKFHKSALLMDRMRLAAGCLDRLQNEQGNVSLLVTNFNSPPDTGFCTQPAATSAFLARRHGVPEIEALTADFRRKAGAAMAAGGVHTPNHRWVVSAALAQLYALDPRPEYVRRIDQWLGEGVDIDADGQYTERSTSVYNPICDRAFVILAAKLNRPALLDPVRRNLESMLYLLHPGYEVVTEISRRQDQFERGDMGRYWFPLRYMAAKDGNGRYALLADHFASTAASLAGAMEYPEIMAAGPAHVAIPEDYEKQFPALGIARIRRGLVSATLVLGGSSRFFSVRRGAAVVNAVRFATAFFGKAQFVPSRGGRSGPAYQFSQALDGPYYQPLEPARKVAAGEWHSTVPARRRSEVCRIEQTADVREMPNGFEVRVRASGTPDVPLAIEVSLRAGGSLEGCQPAPGASDAYLLPAGATASYRMGGDTIRFGPGIRQHAYTQVRGAQPKLPGTSVYLCGYTPFDHTLRIEW